MGAAAGPRPAEQRARPLARAGEGLPGGRSSGAVCVRTRCVRPRVWAAPRFHWVSSVRVFSALCSSDGKIHGR